ncbi:hypothetical protein [Pantoea phage LIMEzero]|uniref:Putative tail fiber protein gp53-like C-terminal domain-containing protein n=1 Tax=Pantoea phage LIMEzero TaxID=943335 RepID=F4N9V1_9CAUD|nr:hypothetical protein LIMEzero_ORF48 [Pantoea phage LIMEzero]CBY88579.1 hypothetical protein [Pantoea phage LIMEzero]
MAQDSILAVDVIKTPDSTVSVRVEDLLSTSEATIDKLTWTNDVGTSSSLLTFVNQRRDLVSHFGADPSGLTDSTAALQAACEWVFGSTAGRRLDIPCGRYVLTSAITVDIAGGNGTIMGYGVGQASLRWTADSDSQGFKFGVTTPMARLNMGNLQASTGYVSGDAFLEFHANGGAVNSFRMFDMLVYGDGLLGTAANGYFGGGLVRAFNTNAPLLENLTFYSVDGSKENYLLTPTAIALTSTTNATLFARLVNCNVAHVGYAAYLKSSHVPGMEGIVIDGFNGMCAFGIKVDASASGNAGYYPPQCNITNSQIEYYASGLDINHVSVFQAEGLTLLQRPDSTETATAIVMTDCRRSHVANVYIEARPGTTGNGVWCNGACDFVQINNLQALINAGYTAIIAGGASTNITYSNCSVVGGGGNLYANISTAPATNDTASYNTTSECSTEIGNGIIVKAGSKTVTLGSGGSFSINWNSAFPNACLTVVPVNGDVSALASSTIGVGTKNVTGFTGTVPGGSSGNSVRINYIAYGS